MPAPPSLRVSARDFYKRTIRDGFARRRLNHIKSLIDKTRDDNRPIKVLDVGCAGGKDFLMHITENDNYEMCGLDNRDFSSFATNWQFVQGDASALEFADDEFDVVISCGVLEHIKPIMKLDKVSSEINRVGRHYLVMVPSNGTWLEPHRIQLNWQKRAPGKKARDDDLFYYSDEAWLQFSGFQKGGSHRFNYIPGLIDNLVLTNIQ